MFIIQNKVNVKRIFRILVTQISMISELVWLFYTIRLDKNRWSHYYCCVGTLKSQKRRIFRNSNCKHCTKAINNQKFSNEHTKCPNPINVAQPCFIHKNKDENETLFCKGAIKLLWWREYQTISKYSFPGVFVELMFFHWLSWYSSFSYKCCINYLCIDQIKYFLWISFFDYR